MKYIQQFGGNERLFAKHWNIFAPAALFGGLRKIDGGVEIAIILGRKSCRLVVDLQGARNKTRSVGLPLVERISSPWQRELIKRPSPPAFCAVRANNK